MEKIKTVLIVDDDENLRTVLTDKLEASGFTVDKAMDGEQGLAKALKQHPDVILLDVMMPKMNGWETLDALRADPWGRTARVIMLTVLEDTTDVAKAVGKGSYEYLLKTNYNLDEIVSRVLKTIQSK